MNWQDYQPTTALVLGSGLGSFIDDVEVIASIPYEEIPELPRSRVPGHAGRLVFGKLGEERVVIAQGRVHLYEGHTATAVCAGVRLMARLGARRIVLTNAAGSLHPDYEPGRWMMLTDHLNLTGTTPLSGGANFIDMTEPYSRTWREMFREAAAAAGLPLHDGVYAGCLGPQYETAAEVRMLRTLGADAVGMSTVLETIQARALDLEVVAFSCLTNWAAGIGRELLAHGDVLEVGKRAAPDLTRLLKVVLARNS